jgi:hypothetical protein
MSTTQRGGPRAGRPGICRIVWLVVTALAGLAACDGGRGDGAPADAGSTDPVLPSVGEDIDVHETKELTSSYTLPAEFYDALDTLGLEPPELAYPDASSTFATTPTRLHWTDTVRHDGQQAPTFGYMATQDVRAALDTDQPELRLRELLVAQYTYGDRDAFVISRYDEQIAVDDAQRPLLAALEAYYEHAPVAGSPWTPAASWSDIAPDLEAQLASWPLETRVVLAQAIEGLTRAAELRDAALLAGEYTIDDWKSLHHDFMTYHSTFKHEYGTDAHPHFDFEQMNRAGQLAVRAIESLRVALSGAPLADGRALTLDGPLGRIAISLEDNPDEWCGGDDLFLLVDGGGDDTYLDYVATNTSIYNPISAVLDLGGDDTYTLSYEWTVDSAYVPNEDPLQGAGVFGVAVLDDAAGDDHYHAAMLAQGCGIFGVGVLADHGGVDTYEGYISSQGHAEFGFGLLADFGSEGDSYETLERSQGYGGPRGIGWLVDADGDDTYLALAEPLIYDWAGEGSNWSGSQGFGYAFGAGLFYDAAGDDEHLITHKYAIGAATHWAIGIYLDDGGADTYRNSGDDECIGLGYDASVAFHIDRGDEPDVYTIENVGDFAVGVSRIPALGVLINYGGDDEYHIPGAGDRALGRSRLEPGNRDGYLAEVINLGMFLDLGGASDLYDIQRDDVGNGQTWIQTDPDDPVEWDPQYDFGYGIDVP